VGIGYGLYPFAESLVELTLYRLIYAVGAAACSSLVAIIANDYPQETSRGKMIGAGNVMNSLGTIFMAGVLAQIPAFLMARGVESVLAGQVMFLTAAGLIYVIMQTSGAIWHIIFGYILDRINRVTGLIIAMVFASIGYLSMGFITSPLDYWMLPAFIILALGSSSAMQSSVSLVGQEAGKEERGAIIGTLGLFGAVGILIGTLVGGYLFDNWAPYGPFVFIGAIQVVLLIFAIVVRLVAPGEDYIKSQKQV